MVLACGAVRRGRDIGTEQHAPYAKELAGRFGRVAVLLDVDAPVAGADLDAGQREPVAGGQGRLRVRKAARQTKGRQCRNNSCPCCSSRPRRVMLQARVSLLAARWRMP